MLRQLRDYADKAEKLPLAFQLGSDPLKYGNAWQLARTLLFDDATWTTSPPAALHDTVLVKPLHRRTSHEHESGTCSGQCPSQRLLRSGVLELQDPLHVAARCRRQRDGAQRQRHEVQQGRLTEASDGVRLSGNG